MSDAELTLKIGDVEFHARGTQEWVSEKFEAAVERFFVERSKQVDANSGRLDGAEGELLVEDTPLREVERWLKQNGISDQQLDRIVDRGRNGLEIILDNAPGDTIKDQVLNLYLLVGFKAFLETGEAAFEDKEARAICEKFGCLDSKHHAEHLNSRGNKFSGSKEQGWKVTKPGMSAIASLMKQISDN